MWLVNCDPPEHTRLRKVLHDHFSPAHVTALRARVEALADRSIDRGATQGGMDIVRDLGRPVAFTVIGDLLGLPGDDHPALGRLTAELALGTDLDVDATLRERGILAMMGLVRYFRAPVARRPADLAPAPLIDALRGALADGHVSEAEVLAQCSFMLLAGSVTSQLLLGNGLLALLRHPDQLALLREQPALLPRAIEELLRYDTPVHVSRRMALTDIEIRGEAIRQGQMVNLILAAANRDPAMFPDPDRLDLTRAPNPHLSFSHGLHHCLGAALARLTAGVVIGTLLRRIPHLSLQPDAVRWEETYILHGPASLPVAFE
jgi:cytochrome P450